MSSESTIKNSKLPFVFVNLAMTADGKIAFADKKFVPFSSRRDREHMMELRATADAVMCGARTVKITKTVLGNGGEKFRRQRVKNRLAEFPLRIIVSGSGSIDPGSPIFKMKISPIIVLTTERISKADLERLSAASAVVRICGEKKINFPAALRWLRAQWNVKRLLCEGGGELDSALFVARLVEEIHLTVCPKIFGGCNAPTIADGLGFQRLADAEGFRIQSIRRVGSELFTVFSKRQ